jgi:hypothetical protein
VPLGMCSLNVLSSSLDLSRLHVAVEVRVNISNQVCASTCSTTPPSMPPGIWPPLCQSSPSPNYVSQASTFDRAKHRSMRTASPHGKIQNPKSLKSGLAVIHPDIRKRSRFHEKSVRVNVQCSRSTFSPGRFLGQLRSKCQARVAAALLGPQPPAHPWSSQRQQ